MCNLSDLIEERGIQKGRMEALKEFRNEEVKALVNIVKTFIPDEELLYQTLIQHEIYKDIPKEVVSKYFHA